MSKQYEPTIKKYRKCWAVFAGVTRLSKLFKTEESAREHLDSKASYHRYWAGSAWVSTENSPKKIIEA